MDRHVTFNHPEPPPSRSRVWPVFLPFAGCPYRCVFCAQDKQTGQEETELETILSTVDRDLESALAQGHGPYELAFYGGTFTALPSPWPERFLGLAMRYRERGLVTRVRCSTRPDCVDDLSLTMLRAQGLDMVELGIQSFDDTVLEQSGRGYPGATARQACDLVKDAGLGLGIQLLPGLPGDRPGVFQDDVRIATSLSPEVARVYPCLVINGTRLADRWRSGEFEPWGLERTKRELADALLVFWDAGVRVIRLGLPPEGTLDDHVVAGPHHPALGQSARGLALLSLIERKVGELETPPTLLEVPRRYQGELFGHSNELEKPLADLGLPKSAIRYTDDSRFVVHG